MRRFGRRSRRLRLLALPPGSPQQSPPNCPVAKVGEGCYIVVTFPGGMQEHIPGFQCVAEAEEWLSGKGRQTWLKGYGLLSINLD